MKEKNSQHPNTLFKILNIAFMLVQRFLGKNESCSYHKKAWIVALFREFEESQIELSIGKLSGTEVGVSAGKNHGSKKDWTWVPFGMEQGGWMILQIVDFQIGTRFPKDALSFTGCWLVRATCAATNEDESAHERGWKNATARCRYSFGLLATPLAERVPSRDLCGNLSSLSPIIIFAPERWLGAGGYRPLVICSIYISII